MKSVIVGTAGHIDHGKSALVRALTGTDPDRLEEEKRRGITIDLGFAHLNLTAPPGDALRLGFIDVPGHEKFVRNMLAGVGGMDMVLLIVAADEGIKPQTREHFDICRLLSIPRGITVLTKCDLVDAETLEVVRMEVEEFVRGSFLDSSRAPIIAVSALARTGLDTLRREMARIAEEVPARDSSQIFRLPIDRVFTIKGHGTVVTGTTIAGSVAKEDEVEVFPLARRARVRSVQVHDATVDRATAGQRTALNLAGVEKETLARGMMLATPDLLRTTTRIDVRLSLLSSARPLKDRSRVHFHSYTAEMLAEVVLLEGKQLAPGDTAFAQLRLTDPMCLLPGDRFIVRQFSPVVTIGGGVVLDASPLPPKRYKSPRTEFLQKLRDGSPAEILFARIARKADEGMTMADAVAETGRPEHRVSAVVEQLWREQKIFRGEYLITRDYADQAMERLRQTLKTFHDANPLVPGIQKQELRDKAGVSPAAFEFAYAILLHEKEVEVQNDLARLAGRKVVLKDDEAESRQEIENAFKNAGLLVPALKDVLAGLKIDRTRSQKIVTLLLRDRVLVKLADELVFHADALARLRDQVRAEKARSPKMDVARFKDLTGVSRKYAIPLLEYLDREHVTRRVGDAREIL